MRRVFFVAKIKKTRDAILSHFQAVSRPDLRSRTQMVKKTLIKKTIIFPPTKPGGDDGDDDDDGIILRRGQPPSHRAQG